MRHLVVIIAAFLLLALSAALAEAKRGKNKLPRTCDQLRLELQNGLTGDRKGPDNELRRKKKIEKKLRKRCGESF